MQFPNHTFMDLTPFSSINKTNQQHCPEGENQGMKKKLDIILTDKAVFQAPSMR